MNHFQRYLAEEYAEDFWDGRIARRDAIKVIAAVTGSVLLAETFLAACAPRHTANSLATAASSSTASATAKPRPTDMAQPTASPSPPISGTVGPLAAHIR